MTVLSLVELSYWGYVPLHT